MLYIALPLTFSVKCPKYSHKNGKKDGKDDEKKKKKKRKDEMKNEKKKKEEGKKKKTRFPSSKVEDNQDAANVLLAEERGPLLPRLRQKGHLT